MELLPMKQFTLTAVMLAFAGGAFAQATVKDDGQWRSAMGMSLAATSGGSKSTVFSALGDAVRATKQDKWALYANAMYGKAGTPATKNADNLRLGTKYDWNLSPQMYAFGLGELQRDSIVNLSSRLTVGGGLGYKVVNTDALKFDIFGGLGYVTSRYSLAQVVAGQSRTSYSNPTALLGEESIHKLGQSTTFKQRLVLFPNLGKGGKVNAQWDAGISVAATAAMNLTAGLTIKKDGNVAGSKTDSMFTTGVSVKFE
jgi:putative salt-induced outer membrane protein